MTGLERIDVLAYDGKAARKTVADIVTETALEIFLNDLKIVTLACTGNHREELAVGYLMSEGLIRMKDDIERIDVREGVDHVRVYASDAASLALPQGRTAMTISSSGARGIGPGQFRLPFSREERPQVPATRALMLMDELLAGASLHEATHGTHCSALAGVDGVLAAREDIGRHNTIDMLCGYALLSGIDCSDKIILTTGRISSEIVIKVWDMGIAVIISHSAPTSKACRLLAEAGMTLIGYVREGSMKVYSGHQRVTV